MEKTALILIDIQNDYFSGGRFPLFKPDEAAAQVAKVLAHFRKLELPIFHIQHISTKPGATFFLPDTKGAEIYNGVAPLPNEKVIVKHAPDSFFQTELHDCLQQSDIKHLVVCGMMTHMCVDTTVRAAKSHGYTITLLADGCTTRDLVWQGTTIPAAVVQQVYMASLSGNFAEVMDTEMWLDKEKR
jgi:nicotinamidase-related amidase